MSPTTRHVGIDVGPITKPHMTATTRATTVPDATIATLRVVGGLVFKRLLPEFGIVQRALHRSRELIHQRAQARSPPRRDVVVQPDDLVVFHRRDLRPARPLRDR